MAGQAKVFFYTRPMNPIRRRKQMSNRRQPPVRPDGTPSPKQEKGETEDGEKRRGPQPPCPPRDSQKPERERAATTRAPPESTRKTAREGARIRRHSAIAPRSANARALQTRARERRSPARKTPTPKPRRGLGVQSVAIRSRTKDLRGEP